MNPNYPPQFITPPPAFSSQPEPKAKSKLPLILVVVILLAIIIAAIIIVPKLMNNQSTNTPEQASEQTTDTKTSPKVTKIHERVTVSSSIGTFGGMVYDVDGNSYSLAGMRHKLELEDGNYFFPVNPTENSDLIADDQWVSSSAMYNKMLEVFGNPNAIIESYRELTETEGEGYYGVATLIWHRSNYYISMVVEDLTNETGKNYTFPSSGLVVTMLQINTNTDQWTDLFNDGSYEIFGKENL